MCAVASAPEGSWGAVSESGRLRQGAGGHPGGERRRSTIMSATLHLGVRSKSRGARRSAKGTRGFSRPLQPAATGRSGLNVSYALATPGPGTGGRRDGAGGSARESPLLAGLVSASVQGRVALRFNDVHPSVVWLKFAAPAEGARPATRRLWGRGG